MSLEEHNKLRLSLGLKPLVDGAGASNDTDKLAEDNYAKTRAEEAKQLQAKKISDHIAKVRNRRALNSKLKGSTLGDGDEPDDALQWVKKSKRRQRALAKGRQAELDHVDNSIQGEYTERDLVNLKVSHDLEDMDEGETRILTLKDSRILHDEEDELQNIEMVADEQIKRRSDLKAQAKVYTGYDDDEFIAPGTARAVLAKYDDVIDGVKGTGFRLGCEPSTKAPPPNEGDTATNKLLLSVDDAKNLALVDYVQEGDFEFKKVTNQKKRRLRCRHAEPDSDNTGPMDIYDPPIVPLKRRNPNVVDDEAALRPRPAKISKTMKLTPEQIAEKVAAERVLDEAKAEQQHEGEETSQALIFDETSEFIRSIQSKRIGVGSMARSPPVAQQPHDISEINLGEVVVEMDDNEDHINAREESEFDGQNDRENGAFSQQVQGGSSLASTLSMLHQQGVLSTPTSDQSETERTQLQHDLWLAEQRVKLAQREVKKGRTGNRQNMDQATREYENRMREQQEARDRWDAFKDYKPLLNLTEYDEFGRPMTRKEAWKALSHKFHGKGSGKAKVEKRLKKVANEKKRMEMAAGDTPLGMNSVFQRLQERTGQAHFVLSMGNGR